MPESPPSRSTFRLIRGELVVLLLPMWLIIRWSVTTLPFVLTDGRFGEDFSTFYRSAEAIRHHTSLYAVSRSIFLPNGPAVDLNLNHPIIAVFALPFSYFSPEVARWLWTAFSILIWLLAVRLTLDALGYRRFAWHPTLLVMALTVPAFSLTIEMGQSAAWLALISVLIWRASRRHEHGVAAALIGVLILLKLTFLPMGLLALARRRAHVTIAVAVGISMALLPIVGLDSYREWIDLLRHVPYYAKPNNASIVGVLARSLSGDVPGRLIVAIEAAGLVVGFLIIRTLRDDDEAILACLLALSLLCAPLAWDLYALSLLPVTAIIASRWHRYSPGPQVLMIVGGSLLLFTEEWFWACLGVHLTIAPGTLVTLGLTCLGTATLVVLGSREHADARLAIRLSPGTHGTRSR